VTISISSAAALSIVVQWRYGGSLNGVGAYITNAAAFLDSGTDVGAFYKVDVSASLDGPFNAAAANGADRSQQLAFTLKWS
jgi:hypothetical protein